MICLFRFILVQFVFKFALLSFAFGALKTGACAGLRVGVGPVGWLAVTGVHGRGGGRRQTELVARQLVVGRLRPLLLFAQERF